MTWPISDNDTLCNVLSVNDDGRGAGCTREIGHDGPHACVTSVLSSSGKWTERQLHAKWTDDQTADISRR